MRVGVYARSDNLEAGAFRSGLLALGHRPHWRSVSDYGQGQVEQFEVVVVSGVRDKGGQVCRDYTEAGIQVVVIDYGYLDRVSGVDTWETGHWQVGLGGLNRIPSFECPGDRFDALGVKLMPAKAGGRPLVLGQHVGDPSHGYTECGMAAWAQSKCDEHGAVFRPHPHSPGVKVDADQSVGPLADALSAASVVYTLCSTGGLEAMIAGVPAVADLPDRACWGELSGPALPSRAALRALCARIAYGQWTLDEMRSGQCVDFVLNHLIPGIGVAMPAVRAQPDRPAKNRRRKRGTDH
ncbi:hypothetical protein CSC70_03825 [Pseudoxanthomonas kalamensis DSM 18571]|uniref:hypothetical protein n=1 Tax=Pseudoxanthomonas kalamensis TaxID=289483 RepID=UPI001B8805A0|nr:hypothetical protein [Pseudoxanthomonas kalamensis]KAF1711066.1 hypothetical protein CSC70_03825 [Pseudoxanthomonas kalamensis DSM 18571]